MVVVVVTVAEVVVTVAVAFMAAADFTAEEAIAVGAITAVAIAEAGTGAVAGVAATADIGAVTAGAVVMAVGAWGWGGLGYGLFFATLPWYYDTYWWDGVPYYYADDNYYQWNSDAAQYETVQPPPGLVDQVRTQAPAARELFIYPKAGQSNEQLARDREECHLWAVKQTGYDPTAAVASSGSTTATKAPANPKPEKREEYLRADGACLEGRNYSVE